VGPRTVKRLSMPFGGGRAWWAHFEFTLRNIEPTFLYKNVWSAPDPQAASSVKEPSALMYPASE